jgi:TetR/AcrR family transcriptional regulator
MTSCSIDEGAILDAAAAIFAEKGFSGARVGEIAALAGVNKAMLYYRVGDKEELYRRVVLRGQQGFMKALMNSLESCSSGPETMAAMISGIARNAMEDRLIPSIILRELAGRGSTLPREGLQGVRGFMQIVRSTVTMGIEEGTFRSVDPVALQFLVMGSLFTLALTTEMREEIDPSSPGPRSADEMSTAVIDILSRGILVEGGSE